MHALVGQAMLLALRLVSRKPETKRALREHEGESIALRLKGFSQPFAIAVRDARFVLDPAAEPPVEVEGGLGTFLALLFGKIDYDAAFFRKKIAFRGSLPAAMRFKALFDHMTR